MFNRRHAHGLAWAAGVILLAGGLLAGLAALVTDTAAGEAPVSVRTAGIVLVAIGTVLAAHSGRYHRQQSYGHEFRVLAGLGGALYLIGIPAVILDGQVSVFNPALQTDVGMSLLVISAVTYLWGVVHEYGRWHLVAFTALPVGALLRQDAVTSAASWKLAGITAGIAVAVWLLSMRTARRQAPRSMYDAQLQAAGFTLALAYAVAPLSQTATVLVIAAIGALIAANALVFTASKGILPLAVIVALTVSLVRVVLAQGEVFVVELLPLIAAGVALIMVARVLEARAERVDERFYAIYEDQDPHAPLDPGPRAEPQQDPFSAG